MIWRGPLFFDALLVGFLGDGNGKSNEKKQAVMAAELDKKIVRNEKIVERYLNYHCRWEFVPLYIPNME